MMPARNKFIQNRNTRRSLSHLSAAEQAWEDYCRGLRAMYPYAEVYRLTDGAARARHFARWARIEAAHSRHRLWGKVGKPGFDPDEA